MHFPITREYKTDIKGINPENLIVDEPKHIEAGVTSRVVVPLHAPFFVNDEFSLTFPNGEPMVPDVHYQVFRVMTRMTEMTGLEMACMIELLDDSISDFLWTYHTVGHFSLIDNTMLELITTAANDNRPIYWDYLRNKPVVFPPTLHTHSLIYEVMAFQDLIDCFDMFLTYLQNSGNEVIDIQVNHYHDLITNYINVYTKQLGGFLARHEGAIDAHGLTALQVGLEKVDNFATADGSNVLQQRKDLHLTPDGLRTIVDTYGFNGDEFLPSNMLPLSSFGNTNFIPPNIDGSFEGLGGKAETTAICLESDGTVVVLGNRFDGRVDALYFSVIENYGNPATAKQTFTGFKYTHPKFDQDGVTVNMVVQGSGKDVILVGDDRTQTFYIGVTNGSLNPSKHVYCKIDLTPILRAVYSNITTVGQRVSDWLWHFSVMVIGNWVYIVFAHQNGSVDGTEDTWGVSDVRFRYLWKVPLASIRLLNDLTPVQQTISFTDMDGTAFSNSPVWQWGTPNRNKATSETYKYLFNFSTPDNQLARVSFAQPNIASQNPQTGQWTLKFMAFFYFGNGAYGRANYAMLDVVYAIDPDTGIMTMIDRCSTPNIDFTNTNGAWDNLFNNPATSINDNWSSVVVGNDRGGLEVLDDLTVISTHTLSSSTGYPWSTFVALVDNAFTRHQLCSSVWRNKMHMKSNYSLVETVVSPVASNVGPKPPFQFPSGELYLARLGTDINNLGNYFKTITGKYGPQSGLTNLYVGSVVGRALTNDIRKVNLPPECGGSIVSVPSNSLDTYGIEVGASSLSMNSQGRYVDRTRVGGTGWTAQPGPDDILLIDTHNQVIDSDGTVSIVPTHEILYPAAIVAQLKAQVANVAIMNACPKVIVTINDPTGYLTNKFGYLPVCVMVDYCGMSGFIRYSCFMTIIPTYSVQGNRSVVTGFTVLDKSDFTGASGGASNQTPTSWDAYHTGQGASDPYWVQQPMRTHYYLNSNGSLDVHFDAAVQCVALTDVQGRMVRFSIPNRTTGRWANMQHQAISVNTIGYCCTPDNGIANVWDFRSSSGGAALIGKGGVNSPVLASVYPQTGWVIFFKSAINVVFNGNLFVLPAGNINLLDIDPAPQNKTFYIYALLDAGVPRYDVATDKRLESPYQLWAGTVTTNNQQIISIDRYNVFAVNGHRITETKQGNAIPAASGLVNEGGQIPWLTTGELLP